MGTDLFNVCLPHDTVRSKRPMNMTTYLFIPGPRIARILGKISGNIC